MERQQLAGIALVAITGLGAPACTDNAARTAARPLAARTVMPAAPAGTVALTPAGSSNRHDQAELLAGSADRLVYFIRPYVPAADPEYGSPATPYLYVRDADGHVTGLGPVLHRYDSYRSVAGDYFAAKVLGRPAIDVVDLPTGARRAVSLPARLRYARVLGATSTGFAIADGDALKMWTWSTGTFTDAGVPFSGQQIGSITTDDNELVVTGTTSGAAVMSDAKPGRFTPLDVGTATGPVTCYALDSDAAACDLPNGLAFVPLDGGAPTVGGQVRNLPPSSAGNPVVIAGDEVMWTRPTSNDLHRADLCAFSAGKPAELCRQGLVEANLDPGTDVVSAYGKAIFRGLASGTVFEAVTPDDVTPMFTTPLSPETAGAFALTGRRLLYVSDLVSPNDPDQVTRLRAVTVNVSSGRVTLGPPHDVAGRDGSLQVTSNDETGADPGSPVIAATADMTVFVRSTFTNNRVVAHLMVATRSRTLEIRAFATGPDSPYVGGAAGVGWVAAAGHRVLFETHDGAIGLYDVRTGRTQYPHFDGRPEGLALTAGHVAYSSHRGTIRWIDLSTGRTTVVYVPPRRLPSEVVTTLVAIGDHVAWSIGPDIRHHWKPINGMRAMPGGQVVHLAHSPYATNARGVLLTDQARNPDLMATWFQPFSGSARTLLSPRVYLQPPQLVGNVLAWIAIDSNLEVAPFTS
ncbi:MAG: hypothetical protein ACTHK4_16780 [Mycobacteriales bacterium]